MGNATSVVAVDAQVPGPHLHLVTGQLLEVALQFLHKYKIEVLELVINMHNHIIK